MRPLSTSFLCCFLNKKKTDYTIKFVIFSNGDDRSTAAGGDERLQQTDSESETTRRQSSAEVRDECALRVGRHRAGLWMRLHLWSRVSDDESKGLVWFDKVIMLQSQKAVHKAPRIFVENAHKMASGGGCQDSCQTTRTFRVYDVNSLSIETLRKYFHKYI